MKCSPSTKSNKGPEEGTRSVYLKEQQGISVSEAMYGRRAKCRSWRNWEDPVCHGKEFGF